MEHSINQSSSLAWIELSQKDMNEPVPGLEGVAGPFEEITFHGDAVVSVHIVLEPGVII